MIHIDKIQLYLFLNMQLIKLLGPDTYSKLNVQSQFSVISPVTLLPLSQNCCYIQTTEEDSFDAFSIH